MQGVSSDMHCPQTVGITAGESRDCCHLFRTHNTVAAGAALTAAASALPAPACTSHNALPLAQVLRSFASLFLYISSRNIS